MSRSNSDAAPNRREVTRGLAAATLAGGGAGFARAPLALGAGDAPPPPGVPDAGAALGTGADLSGRVTAPVRVNGQGPFSFVVDTGANRTVVSSELAASLHLPDAGPANIHGIAGIEPARTASVRLIEVDTVSSRNLVAPLLSHSRLGCDGLLGVDVLRGRRVALDFQHNELRIAPSRGGETSSFSMREESMGLARRDLGQGVAVPARYRFGQLIIIAAEVGSQQVTAFLDSGSQATVANLALRRLVAGDDSDPKRRRYVAPLLSATGQTAQGEVGSVELLRIGGIKITHLTAVFADLHVFDIWRLADVPALLIGIDVMSQFGAVELDFGRRQVVFYPRNTLG